ncbi:MAG: Holliday junction resolvase RuvX [Acidimicrobiaceae bacterium]|jgi:putative Holliday junction resolvase|nr:Holliday junction resolvase RuvX [Acidimicrobiaceae bacterium]|tara:strand:- start:12793 stop:13248 length:456 start_codon:yes stop_codon:yes gene_type:complete
MRPRQPNKKVRALGLDLGTKRIGVAVSDSEGLLATPIEVIFRQKDARKDYLAVVELVKEWEVNIVVVGMPYSLDGQEGPMAQKTLEEVKSLSDILPVPVVTYDERLTTVTAERSLREQGVSSKEGRKVIDQLAAAVLLQAWLDKQQTLEDR